MFAQFCKKHLIDRSTSLKFWFITMIIVLFSVLIYFLLKTPTATCGDPIVNIQNGRLVGFDATVRNFVFLNLLVMINNIEF